MIVVPGPASPNLAKRISQETGIKLAKVHYKTFPDGESYFRIEDDLKGEEVVVVQSCSPPQDKRLVELLLMVDACKDLGAERVIAVVPYFPYARQDKRFLPGEPISVNTVIKSIESAGADEVITFDIHEVHIMERFSVPAHNLTAMRLLAKHVKSLDLESPFVLAPDQGAMRLAKPFAEVLETDCDFFIKHRDRVTGEIETKEKELSVEGRDAILVDDIISTGGTMAKAAQILKKLGARRIVAACTHPILCGNALQRMRDAGIEEIIGTDSIEGPYSKVSLAPEVASFLSKVAE